MEQQRRALERAAIAVLELELYLQSYDQVATILEREGNQHLLLYVVNTMLRRMKEENLPVYPMSVKMRNEMKTSDAKAFVHAAATYIGLTELEAGEQVEVLKRREKVFADTASA